MANSPTIDVYVASKDQEVAMINRNSPIQISSVPDLNHILAPLDRPLGKKISMHGGGENELVGYLRNQITLVRPSRRTVGLPDSAK